MKISRTVVNVVASAVLVPGLSWALLGCNDASQLAPTAPQLTVNRSESAAPVSTTEFTGFINFCVSYPPSTFNLTPGGTLHFTPSNQNRWVTGNPLIDGVEQNAVVANIDLKNGQGVANLDVSLKPDAVNGTWEIRQHLSIPEFVSTGVGHGTGDLRGLTIEFTTNPAGGTSSCNPDMPRGAVQGTILSPAS